MEHFKSKFKNRLLASVLTVVLVVGTVGTASARPMFGSSVSCNENMCEWFGFKTCQTTTYIFWIGFKSGWGPAIPC